MPERKPQTLSNHVRYEPGFHFFLAPVLLIMVLVCIFLVFRHPGFLHVLLLVLSVSLFLAVGKMRGYSLKVQDRVIRLEERLRLTALVPESMRPRIHELTESQLIALRFASDAEAPRLVERCLNEHLTSKQIKQSIENWRPDLWRV